MQSVAPTTDTIMAMTDPDGALMLPGPAGLRPGLPDATPVMLAPVAAPVAPAPVPPPGDGFPGGQPIR